MMTVFFIGFWVDGFFSVEVLQIKSPIAPIKSSIPWGMIIVGQCLLDMGNRRVLAPAELIGKCLPVIRAVGRRAIQPVVGADVLVVHGNFIVMR